MEDIFNININLWDFQQDTIDNLLGENGIYTQGNNLAEVILPTGAGKSYVALQTLLKLIKFNDPLSILQNKKVSETSFCYLSPNHLILHQFKRLIVRLAMPLIYEKVHRPVNSEIEIGEVNNLVNQILSDIIPNSNENSFEILPAEDTYSLTPREIVMKTIDMNLKNLTDDNIDQIIETAFPNFDFRCYQSTNAKTIKGKKTTSTKTRH